MCSKLFVLIMLGVIGPFVFGQDNLLLNSDAAESAGHWKSHGDAEARVLEGKSVFIVRNGGSFFQDVKLSSESEGKFALLIGKASAQRINPSGSIADLPYIYGYMMYDYNSSGSRINTYLQGQRMRLDAKSPDEWSKIYGVFKVARGTEAIRFFLNQASRRGDPHDGSEARFDDLGLYLFDSERDAITFAGNY